MTDEQLGWCVVLLFLGMLAVPDVLDYLRRLKSKDGPDA